MPFCPNELQLSIGFLSLGVLGAPGSAAGELATTGAHAHGVVATVFGLGMHVGRVGVGDPGEGDAFVAVERVAHEVDLLHEEFPPLRIGALGAARAEGPVVADLAEPVVGLAADGKQEAVFAAAGTVLRALHSFCGWGVPDRQTLPVGVEVQIGLRYLGHRGEALSGLVQEFRLILANITRSTPKTTRTPVIVLIRVCRRSR